MKNTKTIFWLIWLLLVVIWNYSYPEASPFLDVLVAVLLSMIDIIILKFFKKQL